MSTRREFLGVRASILRFGVERCRTVTWFVVVHRRSASTRTELKQRTLRKRSDARMGIPRCLQRLARGHDLRTHRALNSASLAGTGGGKHTHTHTHVSVDWESPCKRKRMASRRADHPSPMRLTQRRAISGKHEPNPEKITSKASCPQQTRTGGREDNTYNLHAISTNRLHTKTL